MGRVRGQPFASRGRGTATPILGRHLTDRLNDTGLELVQQMLAYTPNARITAKDALEHSYFNGLNRDTVGKIPLPF